MKRIQNSILLTFTFAFLLLTFYFIQPTSAQSLLCGGGTPARATDLVSTPQITEDSKFGSRDCIVDPKAAFAPYKIPTYDDLKSLYYTQKQITGVTKHELSASSQDRTQADIPFTDVGDSIYHVNGNLTLSANNTGTHTGVVFVEGNLNFNSNYCYGAPDCLPTTPVAATVGTVFVVKGSVNIDPAVKRIDAVIISQGKFCSNKLPTGGCKSTRNDQPLVIKGSIISLDQNNPPIFARVLANNSQPAEQIIYQVKYLVILRHLLSDTLQKWNEIP